MIKATKLRIGNRVLYKPYGNKDGQPVTIEGILGMKAFFDRHSNESGMLHHLVGIPLSEEWLERMGFDKGYSLWTNGSFALEWGGFSKCWQFPVGERRVDIEHIHQLQNLYFALTGEELTMKP